MPATKSSYNQGVAGALLTAAMIGTLLVAFLT